MRHASRAVTFCIAIALGGCGDATDSTGNDSLDADAGNPSGAPAYEAGAGGFAPRPIIAPPRMEMDAGDDDGAVPELDASVDAGETCGNGVHDPGETCDSAGQGCCNATCDGPRSTAYVCRAQAGVCDVEETCDGVTFECPADDVAAVLTTCRAQNGPCDVAEACNGTAKTCPNDAVQPNTFQCGSATASPCDADDYCDGTNKTCPDLPAMVTAVCRLAAGVCDTAEMCNAVDPFCPTNAFVADGTPCDLPSPSAQGAAECSAGLCCPGLTQNDGTGCGFAPDENVVFLASGPVPNGNLGGIGNGDAHCTMLATGANLRGTWHAWLSDSVQEAWSRTSDGPYRDVAGRTVADDRFDLTDGTLDVAIEIVELNLTPAPQSVYTGSLADGLRGAGNCGDWGDSAAQALVGGSNQVDADWTQAAITSCAGAGHLYCFQDDCPGMATVDFMNDPENCGRCGNKCPGTCALGQCQGIVFVTNSSYDGTLLAGAGGGGLMDADDICQAAALGASPNPLPGTYRAWLSTDSVDARDRILDQPYLTTNGITVTSSLAKLVASSLDAPITIDQNGLTTFATHAWTGTADDGTLALTAPCDGWSSPVGSAVVGVIGATSTGWSGGDTLSCATTLPLFCFQVGPVAP